LAWCNFINFQNQSIYAIVLPFFSSGFDPQKNTQVVQIRDGTVYQEVIGVRRLWVQPWRNTNCKSASVYYDLAIMELGKIIHMDK
jgi:hypothetical protein